MALGIVTAARNDMATALLAKIDAGVGPGRLQIYDGTRPATGGTATTLLAELTLSDPAGTVASGELTFSVITSDDTANATGTATWARIVDSDGNFVVDASVTVTGGGGDVQINSTSVSVGQQVICTSAKITIGGA